MTSVKALLHSAAIGFALITLPTCGFVNAPYYFAQEMKAPAPPAPVPAATAPPPAKPAEPAPAIQRRLEELKGLLDKGLITPEDAAKKREEILKSL
jgi:hypothetical protein